jgi:hypothetical protein
LGFKEAAREILSRKLTPTWREDIAEEARQGKFTFHKVLVWSLVISGMGDIDLMNPELQGKGRPPDIRAARVLAELAQELGVEQSPTSGPTFQITLIGGRWPDLPTAPALPAAKEVRV